MLLFRSRTSQRQILFSLLSVWLIDFPSSSALGNITDFVTLAARGERLSYWSILFRACRSFITHGSLSSSSNIHRVVVYISPSGLAIFIHIPARGWARHGDLSMACRSKLLLKKIIRLHSSLFSFLYPFQLNQNAHPVLRLFNYFRLSYVSSSLNISVVRGVSRRPLNRSCRRAEVHCEILSRFRKLSSRKEIRRTGCRTSRLPWQWFFSPLVFIYSIFQHLDTDWHSAKRSFTFGTSSLFDCWPTPSSSDKSSFWQANEKCSRLLVLRRRWNIQRYMVRRRNGAKSTRHRSDRENIFALLCVSHTPFLYSLEWLNH